MRLLKPFYPQPLRDIYSIAKHRWGEGGSEGVILVAWRSPDGCARAAGIQVMGAGEAAHNWTAQCGRGRVQVVPEKGG